MLDLIIRQSRSIGMEGIREREWVEEQLYIRLEWNWLTASGRLPRRTKGWHPVSPSFDGVGSLYYVHQDRHAILR